MAPHLLRSFIIRRKVALAVLATLVFPLPSLAQPFPNPLNPVTPHRVMRCNTAGPAPQVSPATILAIYVHLSWSPVPGAVAYYLDRVNTSLPNQSPVSLSSTLSHGSYEYWDAVPDPRYTYQYSITAMQANGCYGTTRVTVPKTAFTTPNPQYAFGRRLWSQTGATNLTDGRLIWSGVFGATAYRIDGPDMGPYGTYVSAGTYIQGKMPTPGPFGMPLNGQNTDTYYYQNSQILSCPTCTISYPLTNLGTDEHDYKITAIYYRNFADYQHQTAATIPALGCAAGNPSPSSGPIGTIVTLNQGRGLSFVRSVGIVYDNDPEAPGPGPRTWNAGMLNFVLGPGNLFSDQQLIINTSSLDYPPRVNAPWAGHFVVTTIAGKCSSGSYTVTSPTPPPPTTGSLSVSLGFTAGQGEMCQGQGVIGIQRASGSGAQSQTVSFSGLSQPQTVGGVATRGCLASHLFGNLAPGAWTVRAGYPNGPGATCAAAVNSNQFSSTAVWDLRCY
jgi:hypothetical protein